MKLRNKKTGEIPDKIETIAYIQWSKMIMMVYINNNGERIVKQYDSLETFNDEWEDYEEPKEHWAIDQFGEPINVSGLSRLQLEKLHRLGNDFPSENATMKAIEKLKAWERLKDKGFRFCGHDDRDRGQLGDIVIYAEMPTFEYDDDSTRDDLYLLFGGEE